MPKPLVPNKIKRHFKKIVTQLVLDLSQSLRIIQESPTFVDCPNCIWDSINKKSSNVFQSSFTVPVTIFAGTDQERTVSPVSFTEGRCPVCIGEGQLFTTKEICIPAMINFIGRSERGGRFLDLPAGKEGVNFLVVKTLACHYELLLNNEIFVVHNNVKCEKFQPPFVRGLGGEEAIAEVIMQTTEAGQRSSAKFGGTDKQRREAKARRNIKGPTETDVLSGRLQGR
jgi:excinuclease UvrABC ATPase subunit